jgi:hypothetical protein
MVAHGQDSGRGGSASRRSPVKLTMFMTCGFGG